MSSIITTGSPAFPTYSSLADFMQSRRFHAGPSGVLSGFPLSSLPLKTTFRSDRMKYSIHLSTRIDDKRLELPLIDYMTELALEADSIGFGGVSLTEHHL